MHEALVARAWIIHARGVGAMGTHTPHASRCRSVPVHIYARCVIPSEACWKLRGHTCPSLPTQASWNCWGHTRPTLPLLLVHIHARYEELLELMGTHMPHRFLDSSNGPYIVCVPRGLLSSSQPKAFSGGSWARLLCLVCFRSFRSFAVSRARTVRVLCEV